MPAVATDTRPLVALSTPLRLAIESEDDAVRVPIVEVADTRPAYAWSAVEVAETLSVPKVAGVKGYAATFAEVR